jgi:putative N6-adenine-specific DNA methylase
VTAGTGQFFAPCPRGLEPVLEQELATLGAGGLFRVDGGVHFAGALTLAYRVNLESRVASRVLWRITKTRYRSDEDIYKTALAQPWAQWFDVTQTLRVNLVATRSPLKSLDFATLRIKDAVCDSFRARFGKRPSVDTQNPDVRIHAYLDAETVTLYLDLSGEPLFKRGWRFETGEAPLRENLAAGIVRLSGWNGVEALLDPMCGSGTLVIEAAMIALNIAPGGRRSFGFERLKNFDRAAWDALKADALAREKPRTPLAIHGSDLYGDELRHARANANAAGLDGVIAFKQANVLEMPAPAASGVIVTNPPYGVRLGDADELAAFYPKLGDALKQKFAGWRAYILSSEMTLPKRIRLSASKRTVLFNGALECRLFEIKVVAGSARKAKPGAPENGEFSVRQ